jgi:hypothetical protein
MSTRLGCLLVVSFFLLTSQPAFSNPQQPSATDPDGWSNFHAVQSLYCVRYEESGAVRVGDSQQKACAPGELHVAISYISNQVSSGSASSRHRKVRGIPQREFTITRECNGGACHVEIVSFNYGHGFIISVGVGIPEYLKSYFSVQITKGNVSKDYYYSEEPGASFVEMESQTKVDAALNQGLLDVFNLGKYIVDKDVPIRNRKFSETERFKALANLRKAFE